MIYKKIKLFEQTKVRNYWKWLKNKLKSEGSEVVSNTNQLKLEAEDGKLRPLLGLLKERTKNDLKWIKQQ